MVVSANTAATATHDAKQIALTFVLLLFVGNEFRSLGSLNYEEYFTPLFSDRPPGLDLDKHYPQSVFLREVDVRYRSRNGSGTSLSWPLLEEYEFHYPIFENIPVPNFLPGTSHREQFLNDKRKPDDWWNMSEQSRRGRISVVENGSYNRKDDCGYRGDYALHYPRSNNTSVTHFGTVVALDDVPAKDFQHFMDSGLLKLIQAKDFLDEHPDAVVMAHFGRSGMIGQIVDRLGVHNKIIPWSGVLSAEKLVLVCQTPPLHPALFKRARQLLGSDRYEPGNRIIYTPRTHARNGRIVLNDEEVKAYLQGRFGDAYLEFDAKTPLNQTISLFQQARVVIGLHGGGLYNLLYAPTQAIVVEVMPVKHDSGLALGASDKIFWLISGMINQTYWRINEVSPPGIKPRDSVYLNITVLGHVLDRIFH